jgi:hypothetical protein
MPLNEENLTPEQIEVLTQLPEDGWYWAKDYSDTQRPVHITPSNCKNIARTEVVLKDEGLKYFATSDSLGSLQRWIETNIILDKIEAPKEPEKPQTYGMF